MFQNVISRNLAASLISQSIKRKGTRDWYLEKQHNIFSFKGTSHMGTEQIHTDQIEKQSIC